MMMAGTVEGDNDSRADQGRSVPSEPPPRQLPLGGGMYAPSSSVVAAGSASGPLAIPYVPMRIRGSIPARDYVRYQGAYHSQAGPNEDYGPRHVHVPDKQRLQQQGPYGGQAHVAPGCSRTVALGIPVIPATHRDPSRISAAQSVARFEESETAVEGQQVWYILDYWHACDHLAKICKMRYGEGTAQFTKSYKRWRRKLRESRVRDVLSELKELHARGSYPGQGHEIRK